MEKINAEEMKKKLALSDEELEGVSGGKDTAAFYACFDDLILKGVPQDEARSICESYAS